MTQPEAIAALLRAHADGNQAAVARLFPGLYDELRRLAHRQLSSHGLSNRTLDTTALVHEAYLKLHDKTRLTPESRAHFFALAARAMRQIIIDYARRFTAAKRGGAAAKVTLDENAIAIEQRADELVALDEAVGRLAEIDERLARVVECRFFGGFSEAETAEALGTSLRMVQRDWMRARGWLRADLDIEDAP